MSPLEVKWISTTILFYPCVILFVIWYGVLYCWVIGWLMRLECFWVRWCRSCMGCNWLCASLALGLTWRVSRWMWGRLLLSVGRCLFIKMGVNLICMCCCCTRVSTLWLIIGSWDYKTYCCCYSYTY